MGNVHMEARQINYRGGDKPMSVEEALKSTAGEAAAIAQLQTDVGNLQTTKANQITIAPTFNDEDEYSVGDIIYYNGLTYRCVNAHTGEWDADDFIPTTIALELISGTGAVIDYSTTEQITGKKWIDGKDIYQKSYPFDNSANAEVSIDISSLNVERIVKSELSTGMCIPGNMSGDSYFYVTGDSISVYYNTTTNNLVVRRGESHPKTANGYVTIQYTKATA